jgi:capsule polysaccharide modification protein KpsS
VEFCVQAPDFGARSALLLQGPNGPFFRRFAAELRARGLRVTKVNFHAGDWYFFRGPDALAFRGRPDQWEGYLRTLLDERAIDIVYVFGDGRPYHRDAARVCAERGIRFFVFEEGYLRPDWVTLEEHGVNGYSRMPREPEFFREHGVHRGSPRAPSHVGPTFAIGAWYATWLAIWATFGAVFFRHYRHHRSINFVGEMLRWLRGAYRKQRYRWTERGQLAHITKELHHRYFFVALQVHCDYQLVHSRFATVEEFLTEVLSSFARHAPADVRLVIKHHPMDRAYRDYTRWLRHITRELGIERRVIYVHDLHLPSLLRGALGAVMINSTVGLQAIQYGTPVKVLGDAVYDMPGLTNQGPLEQFWLQPGNVDEALFKAFRAYLLRVNQVNGSFARPLADADGAAGLRWFPEQGKTEPISMGTATSPVRSSARAG